MNTSPLLDPKEIQLDVLELITENAAIGLAAHDAGGLLAGRERYAAYPTDYVIEWTQSMLKTLTGQGLVVCKDDRYFPGKPSILQDTPDDPAEYLPSGVIDRSSSQ
jgi:hypothetical protein